MAGLGVVGGGGLGGRGATLFPFGKHRGKTFDQVVDTDAGYCDWALRQDSANGALKDFIDYVRERRGAGGGAPPRPGWSGGAGGPAVPSGSPRGPPAHHGGAPGSFVPGPGRLAEEVTIVCELVQDGQFSVRGERIGGPVHSPMGSATAFMPSHIWSAIGSMPGAQLAGDRRSWLFPLESHEAVAQRLDQLGTVERIPAWVLQLVGRAAHDHRAELDAARLPSRLLPYQLEGVRFGATRSGRCLIGDEMGLGKTLQALALAAQFTEDWPVLVVCPSSLRWVWKEQAEEWLPGLVHGDEVQVIKKGSENLNPKAAFWIISYNLLATDAKKGKFQQKPDGAPHGIVIADESHNIKEWSAARTKALVPLMQKAKRCICLSGTPTRNSPDELHPQLCGLMSCPVRFQDFRNRYCVQQSSQLFNGRTVTKVIGARNSTELNHLLTSTVMVRRLKKEVLSQLPPKRRQKIPIEASDASLLKEIRAEMRQLVDVLGSGGGTEAVSTLFQKTARAKLPAVKEYISEVLERGDEKAIIFAHHQLMLDEIAKLLEQQLPRGSCHMRIDGKTQAAKRPELVKKFQEDPSCRIALLSITACGEGLTLTAAGLVIFAELYWVPGAVEQAEARAHRIGTTHNKVVVEFLVVPNSPDEYIYNSLERKKKDVSSVLDGHAESLQVEKQDRTVKKRASQEVLELLQKRRAVSAGAGAVPAVDVTDPPATKRPAEDAESISPGPKAHEAAETPPPVSRQKIDFLLRAVRAGQSSANNGGGGGGKPA